jgi:hypothetical protein
VFGIGNRPVAPQPKLNTAQPTARPNKPGQTGYVQSSSFAATASTSSSAGSKNPALTDPSVTSALSGYVQTLTGPGATDTTSNYTKLATTELTALTNPQLAQQLLLRGATDPQTGQSLSGPIDPNSDLGKVLTKVVNGTATPDDLKKAGSLVKDKTLVSNSFMDNMMGMFQKMRDDATQAEQKAAQDGDPGAV